MKAHGSNLNRVRVSTPCRLHFGLLRFRSDAGRSFGGHGVMLQEPRVKIEVEPAAEWSATGPDCERALAFAKLTANKLPDQNQAFSIEVVASPPAHTGLGVGTQLALAAAAGVFRASGLEVPPASELAQHVGRGKRSAIGTHGFDRGGLILENGFLPGEDLGELVERVEVPKEWRFLLIRLPTALGKHGQSERQAFAKLPPVPEATTERLWKLATEEILPACQASDLRCFGEALYQFGSLAGSCYASVQGGAYASPELAAAVERLKALGVRGVGQSSWGPTLFAMLPEQAAAESLVTKLQSLAEFAGAAFQITAADNRGAELQVAPSE